MLISACEISAPELLSHSQAAVGNVAFLFSGNAAALRKLHTSEEQGRQKPQQQRVERRGEQTRRGERASVGANSDCYCKHGEGEKLFDVVCSPRLGGFSLSHADVGHRLAKCAAH